ncbi:hypothetical protein WJX81_005102 [Elliptochloris bilobata]|uniref:Formiminotransferase N-terminal subdomain domain-containing protein n=1 Tax=Elliptochloris bilobata TaxID=381761 RepID=A0AAW1RZ01_9CHLO
MLACNVYVSEGRDRSVVKQLTAHAEQDEQVVVAHTFVDESYNRTGFTLASAGQDTLVAAAARLAQAALHAVDLQRHAATHPRLGVVDHVLCSPLGSADLAQAARAAKAIAGGLADGNPPVPVYLYGAVHPQGRRLADIRRALGYFAGARAGQWVGPGSPVSGALPVAPDLGPHAADARVGVCTIGAAPLVINFNVPLTGVDLAGARLIAREVSARGGGLPAVEAMALPHGDGVEVACNLLDCGVSAPADVEALVRRLALEAGGAVLAPYTTGCTEKEIIDMVLAREKRNANALCTDQS